MSETPEYNPTAQEIEALPSHYKERFLRASEETEQARSRNEVVSTFKRETEERAIALYRENAGLRLGIPAGHIHRPIGTTRNEIEADAASFASLTN